MSNFPEIPGTAQIRKISTYMSSMEMLLLCQRLSEEEMYKKLWSVLSRVYEDKKGFEYKIEEGMKEAVDAILASNAPAELKLQLFTSFQLAGDLLPEVSHIVGYIENMDKKRLNIAAFFIEDYKLELSLYDVIRANPGLFNMLLKILSEDRLIDFFSYIFEHENKETITGDLRTLAKERKHFKYRDISHIQKLTDQAFAAKEVFFTTKLSYCMTFKVPVDCVKRQKDLYKILKISINYEERITKEFVKEYNLPFDISDLAICKYYLGNKKSQNQKNLVTKFATHLMRIEDEKDRAYLLRGAFKRGGDFRLYAGCMQDGYVDMNKMARFHYSDADVAWVKSLPGLSNTAK